MLLHLELKNVFKGILMCDEIENLIVESTTATYIFSTKLREHSPKDDGVSVYIDNTDCNGEYPLKTSFLHFLTKHLNVGYIQIKFINQCILMLVVNTVFVFYCVSTTKILIAYNIKKKFQLS